MALSRNLIVYHFSFCSCIFNSSVLLFGPSTPHVKVCSVQVILGNFLVVVKHSELVMLLRLEILSHVWLSSFSWGLVVEFALNSLCLSFAGSLDYSSCKWFASFIWTISILIVFLVFLTSNRVHRIEIVHVFDRARLSSSLRNHIFSCNRSLIEKMIDSIVGVL